MSEDEIEIDSSDENEDDNDLLYSLDKGAFQLSPGKKTQLIRFRWWLETVTRNSSNVERAYMVIRRLMERGQLNVFRKDNFVPSRFTHETFKDIVAHLVQENTGLRRIQFREDIDDEKKPRYSDTSVVRYCKYIIKYCAYVRIPKSHYASIRLTVIKWHRATARAQHNEILLQALYPERFRALSYTMSEALLRVHATSIARFQELRKGKVKVQPAVLQVFTQGVVLPWLALALRYINAPTAQRMDVFTMRWHARAVTSEERDSLAAAVFRHLVDAGKKTSETVLEEAQEEFSGLSDGAKAWWETIKSNTRSQVLFVSDDDYWIATPVSLVSTKSVHNDEDVKHRYMYHLRRLSDNAPLREVLSWYLKHRDRKAQRNPEVLLGQGGGRIKRPTEMLATFVCWMGLNPEEYGFVWPREQDGDNAKRKNPSRDHEQRIDAWVTLCSHSTDGNLAIPDAAALRRNATVVKHSVRTEDEWRNDIRHMEEVYRSVRTLMPWVLPLGSMEHQPRGDRIDSGKRVDNIAATVKRDGYSTSLKTSMIVRFFGALDIGGR